VSEHSARWGNNIIKIEGGISHGQIIDIMGQRMLDIGIPIIDDITGKSQLEARVLNIYLGIVNDLINKGF
jgi:hypothetical protein